MAVTMKNAVFWDVTACGSCKKSDVLQERRSLLRQGDKNRWARNNVSSN
jgi:hypothetical protein